MTLLKNVKYCGCTYWKLSQFSTCPSELIYYNVLQIIRFILYFLVYFWHFLSLFVMSLSNRVITLLSLWVFSRSSIRCVTLRLTTMNMALQSVDITLSLEQCLSALSCSQPPPQVLNVWLWNFCTTSWSKWLDVLHCVKFRVATQLWNL